MLKHIGITKKEFRELMNEDIKKEYTLPLSPLPLLEETVGAILCLVGKNRCFPWMGSIYTVVEGKLKIVKNRKEFEIKQSNKTDLSKKLNIIDEMALDENLQFEDNVASEIHARPEGDIVNKINTLFDNYINEGLCQRECQFNCDGACGYDPMDHGETGCENPMLEMLKFNATDYKDFL